MAKPIATRINVIWLYVRDLQRSIEFYNAKLGIPIQQHPDDPHWAEYTFPESGRLALHELSEGESVVPGSINFDLQVEDIEAAVATLRERGVRCSSIDREPWGSACELRDPDGYRIGMFQPPV